jgi:hypothetical protein
VTTAGRLSVGEKARQWRRQGANAGGTAGDTLANWELRRSSKIELICKWYLLYIAAGSTELVPAGGFMVWAPTPLLIGFKSGTERIARLLPLVRQENA